jgi:hypothetical protein
VCGKEIWKKQTTERRSQTRCRYDTVVHADASPISFGSATSWTLKPSRLEAVMTTIAVPTRGVAGEVLAMAVPGAAVPTGTTTSLACYVQKGSDVTWQWGLNNDNSYYVLNGKWIATPYTGLTKFVTNTSQAELVGAANNAIRYYKLAGYTVQSIFAADSGAGYNYPIVAGSTELYPKF